MLAANWTPLILNPNSLTAKVQGLQEGEYIFRLTAMDDMTVSRFDEVLVSVVRKNKPPIVDAGEDKEITLPNHSVILEGSCIDQDGRCVKTTWKYSPTNLTARKVASHQLKSSLYLSHLTKGSYRFVLQAVDNEGLSAEDSVLVTVLE